MMMAFEKDTVYKHSITISGSLIKPVPSVGCKTIGRKGDLVLFGFNGGMGVLRWFWARVK
jgi:hypothetical protein